nr:MAG TPA: hypothetical protein [Caudoviricetes sp.]
MIHRPRAGQSSRRRGDFHPNGDENAKRRQA